jgi:hypothetical protein
MLLLLLLFVLAHFARERERERDRHRATRRGGSVVDEEITLLFVLVQRRSINMEREIDGRETKRRMKGRKKRERERERKRKKLLLFC